MLVDGRVLIVVAAFVIAAVPHEVLFIIILVPAKAFVTIVTVLVKDSVIDVPAVVTICDKDG